MRPERIPIHLRVPGAVLLVLGALPGWAWAAERGPHDSRYAIREAALEREGDPTASGRFRLNGDLDPLSAAAKPSRGARFAATAKIAMDADCTEVLLADSFE
jgi:hypothetical protein